jgi:hypothetical protein
MGRSMPPVTAGLVFGTITWSSDLGRPATAALHDGFKVVHRCASDEIVSGPAGQVKSDSIKQIGAPVVTDGTSGPGEFRVNFFDRLFGDTGEGFDVSLTDVAWEGGTPLEGTREVNQIDPPPPAPTPSNPFPLTGVKTAPYPAPAIVVFDVTAKPRIAPNP